MPTRYSLNKLKNSLELGTTSNWVVSFESAGGNSADANKLNLINNEYTPAIDVEYNNYTIINNEITVGPGTTIVVPVYAKSSPSDIRLTLYDDHNKAIRKELKRWAIEVLPFSKGQSIPLNKQKDYALIINIYHFNRQLVSTMKDSFYVLPTDELVFRGDQSFSADTLPISFNVIGTH